MPSVHAPALNGSAVLCENHDSQARELDFDLPSMDALDEELSQLAAINAELMGQLRGAVVAQEEAEVAEATDAGEEKSLRIENIELRAKIAEMEQMLLASDEEGADRQREYESLLEEKSEVIRGL